MRFGGWGAGELKAIGLPFRLVPIEEKNVLRVVGVLRAGSREATEQSDPTRYREFVDEDGHLYQLLFDGKVHQTTSMDRATRALRRWVGIESDSGKGKARGSSGRRVPLKERVKRRGSEPKESSGSSGAGSAPVEEEAPVIERFDLGGDDDMCPLEPDEPHSAACACGEDDCAHSAKLPDGDSSLGDESVASTLKGGTGRFDFTYREEGDV